jgi:hypothetical protein
VATKTVRPQTERRTAPTFILPPSSFILSAKYSRNNGCALLADAERAAWNAVMVHAKAQRREEDLGALAPSREILEACDAVIKRGEKMFEWRVPSDFLLDIALDHLTLGRAGLYRAILEGSEISNSKSQIQDHLDAALTGLRRAGQQQYLPLALFTHAWLRFLLGDADGARAELDEAWEIAERGPMPLFMADIHLHRARLFYDQDALAAAQRLIARHAYHRRHPELADAQAASEANAVSGGDT